VWNTRVGMDDEKGVFVGFTGRASGEPATRRDATRRDSRARERGCARARAPLGTRENFDGDDDDGDGDDDGGDAGESGGEGGG